LLFEGFDKPNAHRRTTLWAENRKGTPGYDNILSFMNAATDALLFTQTFTNLAEEAGLGTCFLGTTVYMPKMIIDTLKLPKLVMPVATLTIGWPAEHPALSDRLPLRSIIHHENFEDYTPEKIDDFYAEKEALEENKEFVRINNVETLAQVFTDIRYTKKDCEAMSVGFIEALKQQGFI
jgi:FMN reductase [NAD(P)H]